MGLSVNQNVEKMGSLMIGAIKSLDLGITARLLWNQQQP